MTTFFNFREECFDFVFLLFNKIIGKAKFDQEIYELFMDSFDLIPISALINGKFIALHGGISPELRKAKSLFIEKLK